VTHMQLEQLQSQDLFVRCLFDPDLQIPPDIVSHTARHPTRRFNVYRNNVIVSLVDVLQAYFPVVERLVGERFFRAMARAFVIQSPPRSPILSRYGDGFADFISTFEPVSDLPYLADVARLEWLRQRAYHAADQRSLQPHDFAAVPPEQVGAIVVTCHPSLGALSSMYPVLSIWKANTQRDDIAPVSLDQGGEDTLVVRPNSRDGTMGVMVMPLGVGVRHFLAALQDRQCLADATTMALHYAPSFDLQHALGALMTIGAFVGWIIKDMTDATTTGATST
jgi:hypothetical protein